MAIPCAKREHKLAPHSLPRSRTLVDTPTLDAVVTDPLADVMNFIESYETRYGSNHPVFYQGTYSQVRDMN